MKTLKDKSGKSLRSIIMLTVMFICNAAIAQTNANFSGKWQLDVVNSTNLDKDNMNAIVVDQNPTGILINRTVVTSERSLKRSSDTVYLDGAAHPANKNLAKDLKLPTGKVSGFTRTSTLTWSDDGKSLTINTTYSLTIDDKPFTVKTVEKWTLDSAGQKLTISGDTDNAGKTENYTDIYSHME